MKNNIVTDGVMIYKNYYWDENKQIRNRKTDRILQGDKSQGYCNYQLYQDGTSYKKERNVLLKGSFPDLYQPEHKEEYIDMFGLEDKYCFKKNDPNIVWSKVKKQFIKMFKTDVGHVYFTPKIKGEKWVKKKYVHIMVWESYNKQKYDRKKYNLHHIDFNKENNQLSNIMLLPAGFHHKFHRSIQLYQKGKQSLEDLIKFINNYERISVDDKLKLTNSLNLIK